MSARARELKGQIKEKAGQALGNERLAAEGKADRTRAKAEREVKGAANQAAGRLKSAAGGLTDNASLEVEGQAQRLKGKAQSIG